MHTPPRGTREIDPARHHHKCVCEICTCGKIFLRKGSTHVRPRRCHLREKPQIIITTSLIIWLISNRNACLTIHSKDIMIPILYRPLITPTIRLIASKKISSSKWCSSTFHRGASLRTRRNIKKVMFPIRSAWSGLRKCWNTRQTVQNLMERPHTIASIPPSTLNNRLFHRESTMTTSLEICHLRERPLIKANTSRTESSHTGWTTAGTYTSPKTPNLRGNRDTKK